MFNRSRHVEGTRVVLVTVYGLESGLSYDPHVGD